MPDAILNISAMKIFPHRSGLRTSPFNESYLIISANELGENSYTIHLFHYHAVDWPRIWLEKKVRERRGGEEPVLPEVELPVPEVEG